jgi:CRP-like cAMP-binding protein
MPRNGAALSSIHNHLLSRLKPKQLDRLHPDLEPVHLQVKDILHERGSRLEHAYFPQSGMVSFVIRLSDGDAVEAGIVGSEGMVGIGLLVGGSDLRIWCSRRMTRRRSSRLWITQTGCSNI